MFCNKCGVHNPSGANFCKSCGHKLYVAEVKREFGNGEEEDLSKYKGLKNWLALLGFVIISTTVIFLMGSLNSISIFSNNTVREMTTYGSQMYTPGYDLALIFELIANILLTIFSVYILIIYLKTSKKFPMYAICWLIAIMLLEVVDYLFLASLAPSDEIVKQHLQTAMNEQVATMGRAIIVGSIWIAYIKNSKRVKVNFVN